LIGVAIWASNEYHAIDHGFLLGHLVCSTTQNVFTCNDEAGSASTAVESVMTSSSSLGQSSSTLLSFQSAAGEPYLTPNFTFASAAPGSSEEVGLTNGSVNQPGQIFPFPTVNEKATPQDYLKPEVINPALSAGSVPSSSGVANMLEGGTPIVDPSGRLVGMSVNSGLGPVTPLFTSLQTLWTQANLPIQAPPVASPQACVDGAHVASCWNAGIDAFYGAPSLRTPQYTLAHDYLKQTRVLNSAFVAPQNFDTLALQHVPTSLATPSTTSSPTFSWLLLVGLGSALLVLILLLILVTLLVGRVHRRRRELERFAAEQLEARRIAEAEVQRQRTQQVPAQAPEAACPNCHQPVRLSDAMCPHCRFPLAPSASGLNIRLMGSAPLPPSAAFISEQPTVQFPPNSNGDGSETTTKRQQSIAEQETVENLQQLHGRNLSLAVGTRSDPGIKRKHKPNEDSLFAMQGARTHNSEPQQFGLFVVADGMGGHANGQDASRRAIQTIIDFMLPRVTSSEPMDDNAFLQLMNDGVQNANQAVHDRNIELRADMGTTMTAALVVGSTAYVANVGDSRTYLYREGQGLSKVTNDHSVVASLVEAGIIQPDDIYTHPKRNQIYRSLGEKELVEVDTFTVELQPGDKLLLCSDGLWDMVRDPLIQQVLSKPASDPNKTGQELIKAALEGGGEDNVSVIVAQFAELNTRTGLTGVQLLAKPETVTVPELPPM
jgi:serine/threonine protein phosphatase PrpC/Na+-transporting methylmalonyl-CoA/oxaloacetate decarboxylase gamma subunit